LGNIKGRLDTFAKTLESLSEESDSAKVRNILAIRARTLRRAVGSFLTVILEDKSYVKYLERSRNHIEIKSAPLSVAKLLKGYVYDNFSSVILTSATLTVNRSFEFFATRCGTTLVESRKIGYELFKSSFNYEKQVKFFVPKGIVYSNKPNNDHFEKSTQFLEEAILASGGGALILCSSHDQVSKIYDRLLRPLSKNNIWLLRQTKDMSPSSVIRDFKNDINSVLVGTETLWQGIDVPGESLRALYIYKIPYRMPFLPLIKARKQEIDDRNGNSYSEYYEPLAALMLKQGFGRLIRKSTDKGVVVLLDEGLLDKPRLLNSLPDGVRPEGAEPALIYESLKNLSQLNRLTVDDLKLEIV
jgi:ATP-dependent DNA helicase DinG